MQATGECPECRVRTTSRLAAKQWVEWCPPTSLRPQRTVERYEPNPLPQARPYLGRRRNARRAGRTAASAGKPRRPATQQHVPERAEGERLHKSTRSATGYTGVRRTGAQHGTGARDAPKFAAEIGTLHLGTFSTAVAAATVRARVLRRTAYEVVPWTGMGPRDITLGRQPTPRAHGEM